MPRQASVYYEGMFQKDDIVIPVGAKKKEDLLFSTNHITKICFEFMNNDSILCNEVEIKSQSYRNEDVIVIKSFNSNFLEVGLIQGILYKENNIYFLIYKYTAMRSLSLNYFETIDTDTNLHFVRYDNVCDYKPLVKYGTIEKFKFCLKHHITVNVP